MAVTSFDEWEDARNLINSGKYALEGCIFTRDYDTAHTVADEIDARAVLINGPPSHGMGDIPFGGNRDPGVGRERLNETIEGLVRKKSIIL